MTLPIVLLVCLKTFIYNDTELPWNDHDQYTLESTRCAEIYRDAPCVNEFYKVGERNYHVICGPMVSGYGNSLGLSEFDK